MRRKPLFNLVYHNHLWIRVVSLDMTNSIRTCSTCNKEFTPSSRHKNCPKCRGDQQKKICKCGSKMHKNASTCSVCREVSAELNGNWKGGKTRHSKGYVYVLTASSPTKYKFEHIVVMENSLKRELLPDENVHHINGIKDDNRIENLELWVRPQPSGIRAKDAVAWAKEILLRYGDL